MKSICKNMFNCPVEATIRLIGGKYKAVILWHLMNQTLRYNEIHKRIPNATDKMLAQQLRELEKDGLINRTVYPVVPPKTEYSLTDFGQTLNNPGRNPSPVRRMEITNPFCWKSRFR